LPKTDPPEPLSAEARRARRQAAHRRIIRQRRTVALAILTVVIVGVTFVATSGGGGSNSKPAAGVHAAAVDAARRAKVKLRALELPGGGRRLFPPHRVVAYYGAPGSDQLGALGIGTPDQAGQRLLQQMRPYRHGGRKLLPAMELIAVVAARGAQDDGSYSRKQTFATVERYLKAARKIHALLILDLQPGHADFLNLTKHYTRFLREPDVGLALDPEWHTPNAVPGTVIGSTDARTVNRVSAYLAGIVKKYRLPDKLLIVHQFTDSMIRHKQQLKALHGVPLVLNVDGFGTQAVKIAKYDDFTHPRVRHVHDGFKLFYHEDTDTMTPQQVLQMRPRPDVAIYE
jgi:hypothetical protein